MPCVVFTSMVFSVAFSEVSGFVFMVGKNLFSCAAVSVVLYTVIKLSIFS